MSKNALQRRRSLVLAAAAFCVTAFVYPSMSAAANMDTEHFSGNVSVSDVHCTNGDTGSYNYKSTGTATGPNAGTYTETGKVTLDTGAVTGFSAEWKVKLASNGKTVSGKKTLGSGTGSGGCASGSEFASLSGVTYTTPDESGTSDVMLDRAANPPDGSFSEDFTFGAQSRNACRRDENARHKTAMKSENDTHRQNRKTEDATHKQNVADENATHNQNVSDENARHNQAVSDENAMHKQNNADIKAMPPGPARDQAQADENARHNQAVTDENNTHKMNVADENARHNQAVSDENARHNQAVSDENARHKQAVSDENDTHKANLANCG